MGLLDRMGRLFRANVNSMVNKAEDPEKLLEQTVADMQQDLIRMRQAVAQAIASQKRTERQLSQAQSTAEDWYNRAQMALDKGDETLAREALVRRKSYQETAQALQTQLDQQSGIIEKLKSDLRTLESKISEAQTKKEMYIARARSAQASERLQDLIGGVNTGSSLSAFERMEDKVMELEARSEAMGELGSDDVEKQFAALEGSDDIDAELEALKGHQLSGTNQAQLPSSQQNPEIDEEFDKLRRERDRPEK